MIEAVNVPVPQPEVPPCDVLVALSYTPSIGRWILYGHSSVQNANEMQATGKQIRLFRCTDQPPPPVDQAAVAEAFAAWLEEHWSKYHPRPLRVIPADVARFVADLVESGKLPREGE